MNETTIDTTLESSRATLTVGDFLKKNLDDKKVFKSGKTPAPAAIAKLASRLAKYK
jgi:hypothetical protein